MEHGVHMLADGPVSQFYGQRYEKVVSSHAISSCGPSGLEESVRCFRF
jgi:hypothetical protein